MKTLILTAAILFSAARGIAADAPAVDALRAAKIATDYLAKLGPGAPYIASIQIENVTVLKKRQNWIVTWSHSLRADGRREIGLQVGMDGRIARIVEDKSQSTRQPFARTIR